MKNDWTVIEVNQPSPERMKLFKEFIQASVRRALEKEAKERVQLSTTGHPCNQPEKSNDTTSHAD